MGRGMYGRYGMNGRFGKRDPQQVQQKPHIKNKIIPLSPQGARVTEELLSKIVPWEKITYSLDNFPYYIEEHDKTLLLECVTSHLKHGGLKKYRGNFQTENQRILLQSIPGTELYRARLVSAIARELQVPLLNLDDDILHQDDYDHNEVDEESIEEVDTGVSHRFKKGDRVKYVGYDIIPIEEVHNRILSYGQRGEVYEVDGERVAVVFNLCGLTMEDEKKEISTQRFGSQALVTWIDVGLIQRDKARAHDCEIAMYMLFEVLESQQPIIVYIPDYFWRPALSTSSRQSDELLSKVKKICKQLSSVVMICPGTINQMKEFPYKAPESNISMAPRTYGIDSAMHDLFTNVVRLNPPKDKDLFNTFIRQMEEDRLSMIPQGNLSIMRKVLKERNLVCMNLEHTTIEDMTLTRRKVEKIVGWATNHYLSSCPDPCVNEGKLHIPHESINLAILRLKEETPDLKHLAAGHETSLVSEVIFLEDNGVKFDDIGGLEYVKKVLYQTVILRMRRPEIFSPRSLLKPCRGILLFGPPGTGKSLLAKALATEMEANFMNITAATIKSKNLEATALFSYARKLAPVIIFLDEVDILIGARGNNYKCDTSSRLEGFVAAWDDLSPVDRQRIIVIGATNRPFDVDEAVISRMQRRIYVRLPDSENRSKILKVLLDKENLESGFSFEQLAEATDGYSGSDLENLCVTAAYRPVDDFLEQESKGEASDGVTSLRPLSLNDFIHSTTKVKPSVSASSIALLKQWNEQYGEGQQNTKNI